MLTLTANLPRALQVRRRTEKAFVLFRLYALYWELYISVVSLPLMVVHKFLVISSNLRVN